MDIRPQAGIAELRLTIVGENNDLFNFIARSIQGLYDNNVIANGGVVFRTPTGDIIKSRFILNNQIRENLGIVYQEGEADDNNNDSL
jgi:hypothetical protein